MISRRLPFTILSAGASLPVEYRIRGNSYLLSPFSYLVCSHLKDHDYFFADTAWIAPVSIRLQPVPAGVYHGRAQTAAQVKQNNAVAAGAEEEHFREAWYRFADALLRNDTKMIKALSTDCIRCSDCLTHAAESNAVPAAGTLAPDLPRPIPIDHFLEMHQPVIFNAGTLSRLKDPAKLSFHDDAVNADLYQDSCIRQSSRLKKPGHKEALLLVADPSETFEGAQQAFAFIETEEGYKFCGYSTIP